MATSDLCVFPAQKTCCQVKRLELRLGHPRRSITELFLDPSPPPLPSLAAAYRASIDRVLKLLKNNAGVRDTHSAFLWRTYGAGLRLLQKGAEAAE